MFGQNPIRKFEDVDGGRQLQVREIFYTLQGEGPYSGRPAVFVRLTGCNLRCHFCDTKWDDENDAYVSVEHVLATVQNLSAGRHSEQRRTTLVVLTGGEPLRQNVAPLLAALVKDGYTVQIETAGTLWQNCLNSYIRSRVAVVVSPKTGSIHEEIYHRADAFKYVISAGDAGDTDGLPTASTQRANARVMLAKPRPGVPVYLSPMDEYDADRNAQNMRRVAELALAHGYTAGVQLHKLFNLD